MKRLGVLCLFPIVSSAAASAQATDVPSEVQMPGTQPGQVALESVSRCDNCHAGYDPAVEPFGNWSGSLMAHAARDPLFWATVAVAEQDFLGVGDLCIRCHTPQGWVEGFSTPTDGSNLRERDAESVSCDTCHQMVNPDDSEHLGVQVPPFLANDEGDPEEGYYGCAMLTFYDGSEKLGPYSDPDAPHSALPSSFHRSPDFCGSCHDVSNPVVGDLAPGNGAFTPLVPGTYSGVLGGPIEEKAAFNNFPHQYGVVERTYSEHVASALSTTPISAYESLPAELQAGAIRLARDAAVTAAPPEGNYADGTTRFFTCQSCHMPPVQGVGCNKQNVTFRDDLPLHDLTGGNTWTPDAIQYLDAQGALVLGGGLSDQETAALDAGKARALSNLQQAAALELDGNTLRIVNLTGHKLPSGYPEGRRMWIRTRWLDRGNELLREDGAYGTMTVMLDGVPTEVSSILDLEDPHTRIYEAQLGLTQEWASTLIGFGYPPGLPLDYDRTTGAVTETLGDLANEQAGEVEKSFRFALNDTVVSDIRIPPFAMDYEEAMARSCTPVPATLYGAPGTGEIYQHWDELELVPPEGAASATIELLYQTTSWEYVQFLHLANEGTVEHLAATGADLLDAWSNTGMSPPVVMASTTWRAPDHGKIRRRSAVDGVAERSID